MLDPLSVVIDKAKGMRGQGADFLLAAWFNWMKMREDEGDM